MQNNRIKGLTFNYDLQELQTSLDLIKPKVNNIKRHNKNLSLRQIFKLCGFNSYETEELFTYAKNGFDITRILSKRGDIERTLIISNVTIKKLNSFKKKKEEKDKATYAITTKDISFNIVATINPLNGNMLFFPAGTKVKFAYKKSICRLTVFYFGEHLFPLEEDEFTWIK